MVFIPGMTASQFIAIPQAHRSSKSPADKFKDKVAALLGTKAEHVEIFSMSDVPGSDKPTYPQIFDPPAVDIVFAAHGSPYYQSSRIYGYLYENEQEVSTTSRDRPKSAPYPRFKNSKRTSKCQVFFYSTRKSKFFEKKFFEKITYSKKWTEWRAGAR